MKNSYNRILFSIISHKLSRGINEHTHWTERECAMGWEYIQCTNTNTLHVPHMKPRREEIQNKIVELPRQQLLNNWKWICWNTNLSQTNCASALSFVCIESMLEFESRWGHRLHSKTTNWRNNSLNRWGNNLKFQYTFVLIQFFMLNMMWVYNKYIYYVHRKKHIET